MTKTPDKPKDETQTTVERYSPGFFALVATRITDTVLVEGSEVARERGIDIPARSMSTLLSLRGAPKGVSDLARELSVSHVAIIKTTKTLAARGYIESLRDPADARRRPLALTTKGQDMARQVEAFMAAARATYLELFDEIGVNAEAVMLKLESALARQSFFDRLNAASQTSKDD